MSRNKQHRDKGQPSKDHPPPAQQWSRVLSVEPKRKNGGQKADLGGEESMRMLIKDSADPLGDGEEKHVVTVGVGPIGHGHSHTVAGNETTDADQGHSRQRDEQSEPV